MSTTSSTRTQDIIEAETEAAIYAEGTRFRACDLLGAYKSYLRACAEAGRDPELTAQQLYEVIISRSLA